MKTRTAHLLACILLVSCAEEPITYAQTPDNSTTSVSVSGTLPVMHIETVNRTPITSKTEYLDATYWLEPLGDGSYEPIGSESSPLPMQIRGRGHSSWKATKKPYKIKLAARTQILGMPANKHWALLKPTECTVAGLKLGELMGMEWSPDFRPIEVMLNGRYIGLYFLTETIRIDENRVNIYEQANQEKNPDRIKGGWLVEVDNYRDACQISIPENKRWNLTLRYHSPDDLSSEQLTWLTDEFTDINAAIYDTDKTSTTWESYLDADAIARFFVLQEIMDNPDGFHGSFYLHKDLTENAKWVAGPIWDLLCYYREKTDYTFRMKVHYTITPHWIGELIQYENFCNAVSDVWQEVYPSKLAEIYDYIDETVLPLDRAWQHDYERWNEDPTQTAQLRADKIKTALQRNIEWFNNHLPQASVASITSSAISDLNEPVKVFNLQGIFIGEFPNEREAKTALSKGIYIVNGRKFLIR